MSIVLDALEKAQREGIKIEEKSSTAIKKVPIKFPKSVSAKKKSARSYHQLLIIGLSSSALILLILGWLLLHKAETNSISASLHKPAVSNGNTYPALDVKGIVWDARKPLVLVNGRFLKTGDSISGVEVKQIQPYAAVFVYKGKTFTIPVQQ